MAVPGIEDDAGGIATPGPEGTMIEVVAGAESYCARASRGKRARTVAEASMVSLLCFWSVVVRCERGEWSSYPASNGCNGPASRLGIDLAKVLRIEHS